LSDPKHVVAFIVYKQLHEYDKVAVGLSGSLDEALLIDKLSLGDKLPLERLIAHTSGVEVTVIVMEVDPLLVKPAAVLLVAVAVN
jgi:hypothetical protein